MITKGIYTILASFMIAVLSFFYFETKEMNRPAIVLEEGKINSQSPPCLQMYYYIEKYSAQYGVPKKYAYGVAWKETRYEGAFHWNYDHKRESSAGAVGPMQVMPATARFMWDGKNIAKSTLKSDISLNVETSMKLLKHLYETYKDWKVAFGAYNTGKPIVNQYALDVYNYKMASR
jgi:soluble lytic murein transglycosylase-like protein